jgi:hypothetical protein
MPREPNRPEAPRPRPLAEGYIQKGGLNPMNSQITTRPPPPPASKPGPQAPQQSGGGSKKS